MRMFSRCFPALLVAGLLLTGCAIQPLTPDRPELTPQEQSQAWQRHRASVAGLSEWTLHGRISVATDEDSWAGKLRWRQADGRFNIDFGAPMGIGGARLHTDGAGVTMQVSNGKTYYAPDAESLLYQFIGMRLPVTNLRYWVTGLPNPDAASTLEYDAAGRLARMQQAQWEIRYRGYLHVNDVDLPRKIYIENNQLNVRLVIERWGIQA